MFRYCTGFPWSWSMIGPGLAGSPPIPLVVLSFVISWLSWIVTPFRTTVIRPLTTFFPFSNFGR